MPVSTNRRVVKVDREFDTWREIARELIQSLVQPDQIEWLIAGAETRLFQSHSQMPADVSCELKSTFNVPRDFVSLARYAACHRDEDRFDLLYRIFYRLTIGGETNLLHVAVDDHVLRLNKMVRQVRRDRHKMTAFVRFRKIVSTDGEHYIAWYQPDHHIVHLASEHFVSRFGVMRWSILTPDECAHWDGRQIQFSPGVTRDEAPRDDELKNLWLTYYANIFNPARIKINMMKREMPVRFWPTLPETSAIPQMLADAPRRVDDMIKRTQRGEVASAAGIVPKTKSLKVLEDAAKTCRICPWSVKCTQTVFGEGPKDAQIVFVGEQPGDQEDLQGQPFVGPAGKVFDEMLHDAGIDRSIVYVTNAVKHFKFEPRGKRRIHQKPSARDVSACRPWLAAELEIIKPPMLVCLGATAAQSLLGPEVRITKDRGVATSSRWARWTMVTYHPSALLRAPDPRAAETLRSEFAMDIEQVARQLAELRSGG